MRYNNKITKMQPILGTGSPNKMHLTSDDVVAAVLNFDSVAATTEFMWLNTVAPNFQPKFKIK